MKTISLRLLTIVMCVMASAIGARARAAEQTAQRPNIVLFIADDHAWFDAGCYGNAAVKTPNIDALAASGMRFTRAYTAEAICGPSRATLYTGLYPYRNGGYHQHSAIREGVQTLPTQLKSLGYYVGICGKTDCKPESVKRNSTHFSPRPKAVRSAWSSPPTSRTGRLPRRQRETSMTNRPS
jgi:uncharacterized sulfatase